MESFRNEPVIAIPIFGSGEAIWRLRNPTNNSEFKIQKLNAKRKTHPLKSFRNELLGD